MKKNYDVLEFYKIINELIDLSRLEKTKEKFLDIDIIKDFRQGTYADEGDD